MAGVLGCVRGLRAEGLRMAVVLYTYLNPAYTYGFDRFLAEAADAGVDGVLVLDLPPDEGRAQPRNCAIARTVSR